MGRLIRVLISAVVVLLIFFGMAPIADRLEDLGSDFVDRVGAAWGLGTIGAATVLLALVWLRYGGTNALRRWGVVLKPLPPERTQDGAVPSGEDPPRKRPNRDPRTPTPR